MNRILIADDDYEIALLISDALTDEGYETVVVHDGIAAINAVTADNSFNLVILDIMMPGLDGLQVCRKIRDRVICPILFVSAKRKTYDTLLGLEMGGDDYITKPFSVDELVARVKAHLRRDVRLKSMGSNEKVLRLGEIILYKDRYEVTMKGNPVELSTREFQVLSYLAENAGRVLSKEMIFDHVWGGEYGDMGTVAVHIKNLRDKLDPEHEWIKTVWGVGYKLVRQSGEGE